jgi:hypothetical protein
MNRVLFIALSLPLVACYDGAGERFETGQCPAGETCSDTTPTGLQFIGNRLYDVLVESGPHPTAVGGTQVITLQGDGLTADYIADDDGGLGVQVAGRNGFDLTMWGVASRSNYLRILDSDGLLMDRKELTGAVLDRVELVPSLWESVPADRSLAFFAGDRTLGIALYGDVQHDSGPASERIVDAKMKVALTGAQRVAWDAVEANLTPGTYPLVVTAGDDASFALDVVVVDHADSVSVQPGQPTTVNNDDYTFVCFEALSGGRYVAQASWSYAIDGEPAIPSIEPNCVGAITDKTSGTVTVDATAAGASTSITLSVGQLRPAHDAPPPALRPRAESIPTAGDRAAM